jgi:hypothetical protein
VPARAADQIYFPATDNVTNILVQKINAETVRIDISCWYLTEHTISIALINRFKAGVPVRLIGDRGSIFEIDAPTKAEFYWLANQGLPIRLRFNPTWFPEIDHMKMTLFVGQNLVTFGSANYTPFELAPASPTNYKDETVLFSDDPVLVNAFKTRFDQLWNDTTPEPKSIIALPPYFKNFHDACAAEPTGNCSDFAARYPNPAPMIINTNRLEPDYPTPPDLIWGQGPQFNNRLVQEINAEPALVQLVIYRLTVDNITQALLNKWWSGVPVQLLIEPTEYMNRKWPEFWLTHANLDKLWAAGIPIKQRAHDGLTHMKTLVTSNYATNASSNFASGWERDDNYFIPRFTKPALYQAVKDRVTAMWNSAGFTPFQPQPPDAPVPASPANGSANAPTNAPLTWKAAAFAVSYDVYVGTSPSNLALAGTVQAQLVDNPPSQYSWQQKLPRRTTIFWKVVARTNATVVNPWLVASSPTWSFTTGASAGPSGPEDLLVDFGSANGIWTLYDNGTWTKLHVLSAEMTVTGDLDGNGIDDAVIDFGSEWGIWVHLNDTSWFQLHVLSPTNMVTADLDNSGKDDVIISFPGQGIWVWYNNSTWTKLHALNSGPMAAGDIDGRGGDDLIVDFPGQGVWVLLNNSSWFRLHTFDATAIVTGDLDGNGQDDVVINFPGLGIWQFVNNAWWSRVHTLNGSRLAVGDVDGNGHDDLIVDFGRQFGVWLLRDANWSQLHVLPSEALTLGDLDGDGRDDVVVDFGASFGIWAYYNNSFWKQLHQFSPKSLQTGQLDRRR